MTMTSDPEGQAGPSIRSSRPPRGRPRLRTGYGQDIGILNTPAKRRSTAALVVASFAAPFLITDDILLVLTLGLIASVGAIGLNLVTGYAGQVSLGHAFFLGLGAYTGAVLGGDPDGRLVGFGMPMWVWLPAAGLVAALAGLLVGPIATRLRGLYLAIVTLGVVFLGEHLFRETPQLTGGPGVGRSGPPVELFGVNFSQPGAFFGLGLSRDQQLFFVALVFLVVFAILARNITRSGVGRAFAAVRDRDVAASIIGINLTAYKMIAFALSSFFAGVAGAMYYAVVGVVEPSAFGLLLSIQYLAMVLIGGVATISGSIMGALFITALPRITQDLAHLIPGISGSTLGGGILNVFQFEAMLYGLLIIVFLIFEPRGLYGIWMKIRNYWKGWPFSY